MQDYRKLKVWEKAHAMVLAIYRLTKMMPREENYGIVAQLRRTAISIPTRIADACGRATTEEFHRQLWSANAASKELDYELLLVRDLEYIDAAAYEHYQPLVVEIQKMLSGLLSSSR